jgi:hypothetical protein
MRRLAILGILLMAIAVGATAGEEATEAEKTVTLTGEIVETGCYLERGQRAADNPKCIKRCASSGMPMSLLTADGSLYLILKSHAAADAYGKAIEMAAEKVQVEGIVLDKGGVRAVFVTAIKLLDDDQAKL